MNVDFPQINHLSICIVTSHTLSNYKIPIANCNRMSGNFWYHSE